jgi:hypothetical protein
MVFRNDGLRLPPPWISPAAGMPDREVRPVIIVQRRRLLYPTYVQDYLDRVTAADVAAGNTSGLEVGVTDGANTFIQDLVSDTYLGVSGGVISQAASVIKASVPMAGARTRLGAMTPLVGPAPTSFNFGDNDYNRKTGLGGMDLLGIWTAIGTTMLIRRTAFTYRCMRQAPVKQQLTILLVLGCLTIMNQQGPFF